MDPTPIVFIAVMLLGMYFLVIRPQRRRQADHQKTVGSLGPGARVMLASGVYATVAQVGEKTLRAEIAPGVEIEVLKQAVAEVVQAAPEGDPAVEHADAPAQSADDAAPREASEENAEPAPVRGTDPEDPTKPPTA